MGSPFLLETASQSNPCFETKRAAVSVSAITKNGSFEGYASLFNIVDLGRDLVLPGAFKDSLTARKPGSVKMLWQHDAAQIIGSWTRIVEDQKGLRVSGQLNLAVAKAREVYALMLEGAVDGLSIGFRAQQANKDPATGIRRLAKLDLWEISVVTFPMLPAARVEQVKRQTSSADARLAAAIERGTRIAAETKADDLRAAANFKLAAAINACTAMISAKLFDPSQPRDDHGRWTTGGGGGAANVQLAQNMPDQTPVDIAIEDQNGGHTLQKHVAKSDEFLLNRIATEQYGNWFYSRKLASAGSFFSADEANSLINSTISKNLQIADSVARGDYFDEPFAIESVFDSVTGKEAYADTETDMAYMRKTNGVKVVLRRDVNRINGFYVLTAYPITIK